MKSKALSEFRGANMNKPEIGDVVLHKGTGILGLVVGYMSYITGNIFLYMVLNTNICNISGWSSGTIKKGYISQSGWQILTDTSKVSAEINEIKEKKVLDTADTDARM